MISVNINPADLPNTTQEDGPLQDFLEKMRSHVNELSKFWKTRTAVVKDIHIADKSSAELSRKGLMSAWKFNLVQSSLSAIPALILKRVLDFFYPSQKLEGIEGHVHAAFSWLWPLAIPFILFSMARLIAWSSLKRVHASEERKRRAAVAYLYLDGAYSLIPQALLSIAAVITSTGAEPSLTETILGPNTASLADTTGALGNIVLFGALILAVGLVWEFILKRVYLARKLFVYNGYSKQFKWFWMFRDRGRNLGPWNKYIFGYAYAVPITTAALGLIVLGISWLLGGGVYLASGGK